MKKILLSKLRAMGDTALLSATLEESRRLFPKDEIHLLVPKLWEDLYRHDPRVTRLWTFDTKLKGWARVKEFFSLASQLRFMDFDISLACHANGTSSWLGFLSGAQQRAHHNHNFLEENKMGNLDIPGKKTLKPFIRRDLATLEALEKKVNPNVESRLFVGAEESAWAEAELRNLNLREPVLALGLGASRPAKIWPMEYFSELSQGWHRQTGGSVLAFIAPQERALADIWKKSAGEEPYRVAEKYSVAQMMALLAKMQIMVANDSGPRHVAAAVGVPTLTLYGPQDPFECHPYDSRKHPYLFIEGLKCRPHTDLEGKHPWCGLQVCEVEQHKCLRDISPVEVLRHAIGLWQSARK